MVLASTGAVLVATTGVAAGAVATFCAKALAVSVTSAVALNATATVHTATARWVDFMLFICSLQRDQRAQTQKPMAKYATVQATSKPTDHWPMRFTKALGV